MVLGCASRFHGLFFLFFTGVALIFVPSHAFITRAAPHRHVTPYLKLLASLPGLPRVLTMSIVLQLLAASLPALTALVVDRIVPLFDRSLLLVASVGLAVVIVFHFLASLVRGHLLLAVRRHLQVRLSTGFMDHLMSLPFQFFQERSSGDLLTRFSGLSVMQQSLTSATLAVLIDGSLMATYLVALLVVQPVMGGLTVLLGVIQALTVLLPYRRQVELARQELDANARSTGAAQELLLGAETLKLLGAEQGAVEGWTHRLVDALRAELVRCQVAIQQESVLASLHFAAPLMLLLVGAHLVVRGTVSFGVMLSAAALASSCLTPLSSLLGSLLNLSGLEGQLSRLRDVFDARPEQPSDAPGVMPNLRGGIEVRDVSFRYGPYTPLVLHSVSLRVAAGQMVALVGPSGSGKSTFLSLLLGLSTPETGQILFAGVDLQSCDLSALRRRIGSVPQRPFLFRTTVRENISIGHPEATLDDIEAAARLACLHDDILRLPHGYDTELSEGGGSLSGGQRQRLALARALFGRPDVLVLDEATSALDSLLEADVQANLDALGCTRIVCAHRLSTIRGADLIVAFNGGQIVEQGTHETLVARNGLYAALVGPERAGVLPKPS